MSTRRNYDSLIHRLAAPALGVVHDRDLRAAGVPGSVVARRVATGRMAPVVGRSFRVGPDWPDPSFEVQCMAAAKAAGPLGRIDGVSAAMLLGAWNRRNGVVHATTPASTNTIPRSTGPFRFSRATGSWLPDAPLQVGPVPIVDPCRILATMARTFTPWQVASVLDGLMYREITTFADVAEFADGRSRAPGNAALRHAVELIRAGSVGTRGYTEDAMLAAFIELGLPVPIVNQRGVMGLVRDEPDFVVPVLRANIECDGPQHDDPRQRRDDDARDAQLEAMGWRILRVRASDFRRRRQHVLRQIHRFLMGETVPLVRGTRTLLVR